MKKLILLSVFLFPILVYGQSKNLNISHLMIEKSGKALDVETTQSFPIMDSDRKPYMIYSSGDVKIGFYLTYKIKGERVKLSRQVFIIGPGGDEIKGKRRKDVIFFKTGHQDAISTKVSENILTDKASLTTYFISFDYELLLN